MTRALVGVAKVVGHCPANRKVASSIPSQVTCLGCGPGPQEGVHERQKHIDISLSPFLPLFLKINK